MAAPMIGDLVVVPFPFSDLSGTRKRPAVVLALAERGDLVLCQVTSRSWSSTSAIPLSDDDFSEGGLERASFARPDKLFTASASITIRTAGRLTEPAAARVRGATRRLFD